MTSIDEPEVRPQPGEVHHCELTGRSRTFVRWATGGLFGQARIWAVESCVASAGSPVPWDTERVWPWVVHVDCDVPCRDTGKPFRVTFSMPALGPPGSPEWRQAELAAVRRMGVHEAMESFGFDPHTMGGDTPECPAIEL